MCAYALSANQAGFINRKRPRGLHIFNVCRCGVQRTFARGACDTGMPAAPMKPAASYAEFEGAPRLGHALHAAIEHQKKNKIVK